MAYASMAFLVTCATWNRANQRSFEAFLKGLPLQRSERTVVLKPKSNSKLGIEVSLKENAVRDLTAAALTASVVILDVALTTGSEVSPSLKNFMENPRHN